MSGTSLRAPSVSKRRSSPGLEFAAVAALLAVLIHPTRPLLLWNLTDSAPTGLYRLTTAEPLQRGDLIIAKLDASWQRFAVQRHYLGNEVPVVKYVAALGGDRVCADARMISVDGAPRAARRSVDGEGRPLPRWTGCSILTPGQVLLLNPNSASFDGRYFGLISKRSILGRAIKL